MLKGVFSLLHVETFTSLRVYSEHVCQAVVSVPVISCVP